MRRLVFCSIFFCLTACKLDITPPDSGTVESVSGSYTCSSETPCQIDVVDFYFNEVFVPRPAPGHAFTGWASEEGAFCGGQHGDCRLDMSVLEGNRTIEKILASNRRYTLTPTFAPHDRLAFDGLWYGKLLGSNGRLTTENEKVVIAVFPDAISITESRVSERVTCEYSGQFRPFRKSAGDNRRAKETISGTYQCDGVQFSQGNFRGYIYAITDHHTVIELNSNSASGEKRSTVSVLHRDEFILKDAVHLAAELPGREFKKEDLGAYQGNQVRSGPKCAAFPAEDSFAQFRISESKGGLNITTSVAGAPGCRYEHNGVYSEDYPSSVSGSYECDDGSLGLWRAERPRIHETPQGSVVSMEITRFGNPCEVMHHAGWRKGTVRD